MVASQEKLNMDQLVTFRVANEELAVPIQVVQEIIRVPDVTRVPRAPGYVDGMGNLRGDILPIINLRRLLGMEEREKDEATRVIVIHTGGTRTGVVVDGVSEVLSIDEDILEPPPAVADIEGQYLRSVAKVDEGKRLILILDESKVLPAIDSQSLISESRQHGQSMGAQETESRGTQEELEQLVTFQVASEEYALPIMSVKEIIRVTEITPVPRAPGYVLGVMSLRNHLLPIVDLATRFGLARAAQGAQTAAEGSVADDNQRIVVIDLNGILTGIRVDSVSQVLRMEKSSIEPPPQIVTSGGVDCLMGVGKLDNGKRLLMLLDATRLIPADERQKFEQSVGKQAMETQEGKRVKIEDEVQVVCFRVDREEYAIDIMRVQEIIRLREITSVPHARTYMEGIINLRGVVVPVVDMRGRFGLTKKERAEENRIVITTIQEKVTGLIVDSVSEVLRLQKSQVEPPPVGVAGVEGRFIDGVGKLEEGKRMLILVRLDALLDDKDQVA